MKTKSLNIATAQIYGIEENPSWFEHRCFFAWYLHFTMPSYYRLEPVLVLNVGKTFDEVKSFFPTFRNKMRQIQIEEGQMVGVIFENDGHIRAFAATGSNYWVDVQDQFKIKTFKELGIEFDALNVY